jgi:hypothetical protein
VPDATEIDQGAYYDEVMATKHRLRVPRLTVPRGMPGIEGEAYLREASQALSTFVATAICEELGLAHLNTEDPYIRSRLELARATFMKAVHLLDDAADVIESIEVEPDEEQGPF